MMPPLSVSLLLALTAPLALAQTPAPQSTAAKPAAVPKPSASAAKPYVTVNGVAISQSTADAFLAELKSRGAPETPELHASVREEMIHRGVLVGEAKKRGLDKRPDFKRQVDIATQLILMRSIVAEHLQKNPPTEAELQAAYREALGKLGKTEYKLRHIQHKSEAEAKETIAKLRDGKKFDKLVKDSTDSATVESGGRLGWRIPAALPPEAARAIEPLKKDEYTLVPVRTEAGYHIFLVEEQRPYTPPTLETLKPQLLQAVQQQKAAQLVASLRAQATVK